jgi:NADH-quinone oxidoreductase subunit H
MSDTPSLRQMFAEAGNIDLLTTYRGQQMRPKQALERAIKYLLVCAFWVAASYGAGAAAALGAVVLTPYFPIPGYLVDFAAFTAPLAVTLTFIPVNAMFLVLMERKLLALLTTRLGPNRVGPNGLLQTFADALKLLFKEDTRPRGADKLLFFLAPGLFFAPSVLLFLPLMSVASQGVGPFAATQFDTSLLFGFAVSSIAVMGMVLAGWAANNKYTLLGGLRSTAQAISYEIPLILSLIAVIVFTGSLDLLAIAQQQSAGIWDWNILAGGSLANLGEYAAAFEAGRDGVALVGLSTVLGKLLLFPALALMIYFCSLAEVNRIPFDLPEAESELVSGYNTELSGMKFALFFLAEYTNLFAISALLAVVFFGGPYVGIPAIDSWGRDAFAYTGLGDLSWALGALVLLVKTYLLVSVAIWVRATLPRFRSDQLMGLAWRRLIPVSIGFIFVAAVLKVFSLY